MAYDEDLADRVRGALGARRDLSEMKMFGGIGFMLGGNMAVGVHGDDLIVRISPDEHDAALRNKGARTFDLTGRPMKGWILVGSGVVRTWAGLGKWVARGADYASSLPPKGAPGRRTTSRKPANKTAANKTAANKTAANKTAANKTAAKRTSANRT